MINQIMIGQFKDRAQRERDNGATIDINYELLYIVANMSNGDEHYFQDFEALELVNECGELFKGELDPKDFILASIVSGRITPSVSY